MLRLGDRLDVTIEKGVYRGLGLARHEGQVVLVPRGLPGDALRVRVESVRKGFVRAGIEEVVRPGPSQRESPCPYVPRCGGCAYQPLAYDAQLALKEAILRESLSRAGVAWEGEIPVHGSPETGWRMRCVFHLGAGTDGALNLGLREEKRHRVVDLERCLQLSDAINGALRALLAGLRERPHLARHVRDVAMAESADGAHLVACLETDLSPHEATGLSFLADAAPWLTGLGIASGPGERRRFVLLRGDPHVHAAVAGFRLRSHVLSFFQGNRFLLEDLVRTVVDLTPPGGSVLDIYSGVGLFALPLAAVADRVRGAELSPSAVEDAAANVRSAALSNVRVDGIDALEALRSWPVETEERIVLDPPRTGAGTDVVAAVVARRPASIVYVSCDPPTLARDLATFAAAGYRADAVSAFDLFPDTLHLEAVVHLGPA